jgi:hypothetical protein
VRTRGLFEIPGPIGALSTSLQEGRPLEGFGALVRAWKAQKKPRRHQASSGLEIMKGCHRRITNRGLTSMRRSPLRELKRLSKPRVPSELKATASSRCSRVGGALLVLSLGK